MNFFNLQLENVHCGFLGKPVLRHISFSKSTHGVTTIVGENGVGKSLLLRTIAGITLPSRGQVSLRIQTQYYNTGLHEEARKHIGYQSEYLAYWPEYNLKQVLQLVAKIKMPTENALEIADKAIEQFNLQKEAHTTLRRLSFGFQRRISLAMSMMNQPELLLLDEPTNGLDPSETESFLEHIKKIAQHSCVLVATHRLDEMAELKAAALLLIKGKLAYDGPCPSNPKEWYHEQYQCI